MNKTPLYYYPRDYAKEHDEIPLYRESFQANVACKEAIEAAVRKHYNDNCLGGEAAKEVVQEFGFERTMYVLANTIRHKDWDGRISPDNKRWARTIPVYEDRDGFGLDGRIYFVVDRCHSGLMNIFINQVRHDYLLTQPLKVQDIYTEALRICCTFENAPRSNGIDQQSIVARVSPQFMERAKKKDLNRLAKMLPHPSAQLTRFEDGGDLYAQISADENRHLVPKKPRARKAQER